MSRSVTIHGQNGVYIWGELKDDGRFELQDRSGNYFRGEISGRKVQLRNKENVIVSGTLDDRGELALWDDHNKHYLWGKVT